MKLPTPVSPGAAARRSLLADLLLALLIAAVVIALAAGIGVVGFLALVSALVLAPWYLVEGIVGSVRRRRRAHERRSADRLSRRTAAAPTEVGAPPPPADRPSKAGPAPPIG